MTNNLENHAAEKTRFKALWDFVFLSGGESIGKIAGFLAFAYLARTLNSASYGAVELAVAMLAIFGLVVDFGLGQIGAREISQDPKRAARLAALVPGARLIIVLFCIPLMCGIAVFMDLPTRDTQLIWLVSLALFSFVWNQVWVLQGLEKMGFVSFNQALRMVVFALGVFLFVENDEDLLYVGTIEVIAAASMAMFLLVLQRREGVPIGLSVRRKKTARLFRQASSIGFSQIVWALNQYVSIILVAFLAGAVAGAWFAAAHRIVNALTSYSLVYHFNLFPATSSRIKESAAAYQELVQASTRVASWFGVAVALAGTLLATPICILVYGPDFSDAGLSMAVLVWSLPLTIMSGHARFALIATGNQRHVLTAQSFGAVVTIVTGALLIPIYGPVGASVSMILSHAIVWTTVHYLMRMEVCRIPAIEMIVLPVSLAAISFFLSYVSGFSLLSCFGSLVLFAISAPILDRRLVGAIKRLSKIKNRNRQVETQE